MLLPLSNANPLLYFTFLPSPISLYTEAHPSTVTATLQHTHTRAFALSLFFTSDVVLSVFPPVDHLVVVIEEVLCNASIGPTLEQKS